MNKRLISLALGGALAAGQALTAQAGVTIFGHLDEAFAAYDEDPGVATYSNRFSPGSKANDDIVLVCTTCSLGIKGAEPLGGGLKAIFKADFQFDINNRNSVKKGTGNGAITDRDQWLGLAGENWGKVRFGTISTGYKSTGAMIDPLYRTVAQGRDHRLQSRLHSGAGENGQGRLTNHIRYDSPSFSGFKAIVDYSFDSNGADGGTDNAWAVTGVYKNGPILGFGSYITNGQGGKDSAWKLGGAYSWGPVRFYGQYENDGGLISEAAKLGGANIKGECRTKTGNPACVTASNPHNAHGANIWHVGASFTLANNLLYMGYSNGQDISGDQILTKNDRNTSFDAWTLAAAHMFSKRTEVYFGYNREFYDNPNAWFDKVGSGRANSGSTDVVVLGMKHRF